MAVPVSINDISATAASNSPAGSDAIGTTLDDFLRAIQSILKESGAGLYTASGTNTITFTSTPAFTAYAAGQRFWFIAEATNTGAVTLNINTLGAKAVTHLGSTALVGGEIKIGAIVTVVYDGTRFQLVSDSGVIAGTSTNDSAAAGSVGEYKESVATSTAAASTTVWKDLASISLTAGDWDVSALASVTPNSGSLANAFIGIGTVTGNDATGVVTGDTRAEISCSFTGASLWQSASIPPKRVSLAGSATYYLKIYAAFGGATPNFVGRISARRVR